MQIYSSEIVRIGEQANLFLDEGIVVFFGDNAPEELQDFAVIHKLEQISGEIVVGTKISLSDSNLEEMDEIWNLIKKYHIIRFLNIK